jgi:hypothetical protein
MYKEKQSGDKGGGDQRKGLSKIVKNKRNLFPGFHRDGVSSHDDRVMTSFSETTTIHRGQSAPISRT